jgi:hypothetical protein
VFAVAWLAGVATLLLHAPAVSAVAVAFLQHARHGELSALPGLVPVVLVLGSLVWALASWAIEEWA